MASEKELQWLDIFMSTGNDKLAVKQVFDCAPKNVAIRAAQLKSKLAPEIDKRLRDGMRTNAVVMYNILAKLAIKSQSETVQVKAAIAALDRGGYKPVDQVEDVTQDTNPQELQEQIAAVKAQLIAELTPEGIAQIQANHEQSR